MQVILSAHARDMFAERWCCAPDKYEKIARKAFFSKERVLDGDIANRMAYQEYVNTAHVFYRKFMGRVFIFEHKGEGRPPLLITLYPAAVGNRNKRKMSIAPNNARELKPA